jgi:DNA-directed RNA polymerase specialized sigma24 family protein
VGVQLRAREGPYLDDLAFPESEEPAAWEGLGVSIEALLQGHPAHDAAILRLRVLGGQSLRGIAGELGISTKSVSRRENAALAAPAGVTGIRAEPWVQLP